MHGHTASGTADEDLLDYSALFNAINESGPGARRATVGTDLVAITKIRDANAISTYRFVSGNVEEPALTYDFATGADQPVDPGRGRLVVSSAWVVVDAEARIVVVENRRPGVPIYQIERFLSQFGREQLGLRGLVVSLHPVAAKSFAAEIERLDRIRQASITLHKPNHSWTRSAEGLLGQLASSNATDIKIELSAARGDGLAKDDGIVSEVIGFARRTFSALKNAAVTGIRDGRERTVSLRKHTVRSTIEIPVSATDDEELELIEAAARGVIAEASDAVGAAEN